MGKQKGKLLLSSLLFILSGFILLPLFNSVLARFFKVQLSGWIRFFIFLSLVVVAFILAITALSPLIQSGAGNYTGSDFGVDENSPDAIKEIIASIGEVSLKDNVLSFDVLVENGGNVQVSFQIIRLIFVDSQGKEVYSVDAKGDKVMNLYPGEASKSEMKVSNWNYKTDDYKVSASVLDLNGGVLTSTEKEFHA